MAIDKDPSIYRDRGMIGSSEELDEYGVWVKSEPEDLASGRAPAAPIEEPTLPDIEDLPDLELDSTDDFSFPEPEDEAEAASDSAPLSVSSEKEDFSIEENDSLQGDELPSFEDIASFETEVPPVSNEDFTELSMDDFLEEGSAAGESAPAAGAEDETLHIDLDFDDSAESPAGAGEADDFGFQVEDETPEPTVQAGGDISLETVSDFDDFLNDLSDTDTASEAPPSAPAQSGGPIEEKAEVEDIAIDVEESEPLAMAFEPVEEAADIVLSDFETSPEAREEAPSLEREGQEPAGADFDDLAALSRDLAEGDAGQAPAADAGLSTQLLMRIADELSSIKTELSSLKEELSVLRGDGKPEQAVEKAPPSSHGFFDEEDDEKIALTGDELDNILNTADFTEEAGADATEDMSDEDVIDDFLTDRNDLLGSEPESVPAESAELPVDGDFGAGIDIGVDDEPGEGPAFNEEAEESYGEPAIERIEIDESAEPLPEELQTLQKTGVNHMTAAPEDTSYLEAEGLPATDIDLSEAVIDEPDLGSPQFEEPPIEEPALDTTELDLDMEETFRDEDSETASGESADFEEMELTLDEFVGGGQEEAGNEEEAEQESFAASEQDETAEEDEAAPAVEESFAEVVPEGFVVEPEDTPEAPETETEAAETIETVDFAEESQEEDAQPLPVDIRQEVRAVLSYMDQLLESLPEDKIEEFAKSEYFDTYKKLFEELGLV